MLSNDTSRYIWYYSNATTSTNDHTTMTEATQINGGFVVDKLLNQHLSVNSLYTTAMTNHLKKSKHCCNCGHILSLT